jgi:hypothetical protein
MPDYSKSKIYKIVCNITGLIYIGSTCQTLCGRLGDHKSDYKKYLNGKRNYVSSFKIIANENYDIILVEQFPCQNKDQLHARERFFIENCECVNINIPTRTPKEYREDHKEKIKEYEEKNKEKRKEQTKQYRENNKEKLFEQGKQYRENNKEKIKEYEEKNKEKRKERGKQYREEHREKMRKYIKEYYLNNKEKAKQYYENNKEKIKEQKKEYHKNNKEKRKEYDKQRYLKNKEKTKPPENVI